MVDGKDLWGCHTSKLIRRQWNQVERSNPYKPGLRSGYQYVNNSPILVMNDYGDLVYVTDEDGVEFPLTAPEPKVDVDWFSQALVCKDDYGNSIYLDGEDEYGLYRIQDDYSEDAIFKEDKIHEGWLTVIPGTWELPRLVQKTIQESGWDVLHSHASLDGMLCVRWLGLYGTAPYEENSKLFGFNSEPDQFLWGDEKNYTRKIARKLFQFETQSHRELAAECFPMEMGSLLARYKYFQEECPVMIGLVIDQAQSELRRIYQQDCYSYYNEQTGELDVEKTYVKYWEGWTGARAAYESYSIERRLTYISTIYTEGFVRNSSPCAMVVYGDPNYLDKQDQHLVKKFKKNGFPIYWLQTNTESLS